MKTLVMGIGNLLMGDEGAGIHVLRYLEQQHPLLSVDFVDGGTGGFHLLEYFQTYERVILIDATMDGEPPGTVRVIKPEFARDYPRTLAAHDIGLKDLLDSLYLLGKRPQIVLFTLSIAGIGSLCMELSDDVQRAVRTAAEAVTAHLESEP